MASSPPAGVQTGQCSDARDSVPATAPEGANDLEAAAQLVVSEQPRKVHGGRVRGQRPVAHVRERLGRAVPGDRRVDEQDRTALAAVAVRDQQRARADVDVARQRRDAQEIEAIDGIECEEPGALAPRNR